MVVTFLNLQELKHMLVWMGMKLSEVGFKTVADESS
jgi:hypothetical protein